MNTQNQWEARMAQAQKRLEDREWERKVGELVGMIDELAGERSPAELVASVRQRGYNIEADVGTLERRGLTIN